MKTKLMSLMGLMGLMCLMFSGCMGTPRLKGGHSDVNIPLSGVTASANQPQDPKDNMTQAVSTGGDEEMVLPAGSVVKTVNVTAGPKGATVTNVTEVTLSAPTPLKKSHYEKTDTKIGAAQKNVAAELAQGFKAMQPVMWVGILVILGGAALAYFGWWTKAALCWAVGGAMIVTAAVVPGHSGLILAVGLPTLTILCLVVLYVYFKGHYDSMGAFLADMKSKVLPDGHQLPAGQPPANGTDKTNGTT